MTFFEELNQIIPKKQISKNQTLLEQHSRDESYHQPCLPEAVVFPASTAEVSEIMKLAARHQMPVVPFGYGSSLEGNIIPYSGGISLDFSLMNNIITLRENDFLVTVQPGVTRSQLNKELKKYGMFFSVDPGADATLGGDGGNQCQWDLSSQIWYHARSGP
ncbi:FAD-binding oxidoreductase [Virgibacillus halophilus]|uniref:FAD-binding oxidoreductase n=1 Tax=Tigheibacillus halophilus TaxID=361280 RepID=A0ABU5C218_9BACI|nr:FAD-binding oxidoreductase [Virgibacillus halophilus]